MRWERDSDSHATWYTREGDMVGVLDVRDLRGRSKAWTVAYVSDGQPAGRTNQYEIYPLLAEAKERAEVLNERIRKAAEEATDS